MFLLGIDDRWLRATGAEHTCSTPVGDGLEDQIRSILSDENANSIGMLVGTLPFDDDENAYLVVPERATWYGSHTEALMASAHAAPCIRTAPRVVEAPDVVTYQTMVRQALASIAGSRDKLRKVVLARSLRIDMAAPPDLQTIVMRLARDPAVTVFLADLPPCPGGAGRTLVGATPELLVSRRGLAVASHPLAGSARRSADPAQDRENGRALLRSDKDQREHALAAEAVLDLLAPFCSQLSVPAAPSLHATATMWHLGTRVDGVLKSHDAPSAAGLAALLHPTPAVGGDPREAALATIRALEPVSRGYYGGAIGWVDASGDGEWYVTLRCAQIEGSRLVLHAGAGIVDGSDPASEAAETAAKFLAMLQALGLDVETRVLDTAA